MGGVLLDFSNLQGGGGLSVASATLHELSRPGVAARYPWIAGPLEIRMSPDVAQNLLEPDALPGRVRVERMKPSFHALFGRPREDFDVRFTLFGPAYSGRLARREIVGFAQPLLIYGTADYGPFPREGWRTRAGLLVKRLLVTKSDIYVTEAVAVADRLSRRYGIARDRIEVVANRPHPFLLTRPIRQAREAGEGDDRIMHLIYPARAYPHKNFGVIGPALSLYAERTGRQAIVHVTLRDAEWQALPEGDRRLMRNHGEVTPATLAELYEQSDAVLFPSLLEASSATPLEANAIGLPLLAGDRDFVRSSAEVDVCFEPTDPASIAEALILFDAKRQEFQAAARQRAVRYREVLTRTSRAEAYFNLISRELAHLN